MKNLVAFVCRAFAAGALLLFLTANNAGAGVVFRGAIDPIFGLDIDGLSYRGEALFNVADDCLNNPLQNGTHDPDEDSCGGVTLISESITLTNSITSATQTLTFWPDPTFTPTDPITAYVISGGTLGAVDTVDIGPQLVTVAGLGYSGPLWLNLFHQGDAFEDLVANAVLLTGTCDGPSCSENGGRSNVATVTITQVVPEPATVALLLAAMTAGWIVRRKGVGRR